MDFTTFKNSLDAAITNKAAPSTISPGDVGAQIKALADLVNTNFPDNSFSDFGGRFATTALANTAIPNTVVSGKNQRDGKVVFIGTAANYIPYWWNGGTADVNLVEYVRNVDALQAKPYKIGDRAKNAKNEVMQAIKDAPLVDPAVTLGSFMKQGLTTSDTYNIENFYK